MGSVTEYFEQYALISLEKQARLFAFLGEHFLELDLDAGTARFGGGRDFPVQVLGTESEHSLTWLWAWAEEQTEVPDALLRCARELKAWGERRGLSEFILPSVDLDRADGTMLSLIASEVCRADGYYRDHYEGGALFLLLSGTAVDRGTAFDRAGLIRQLGDLAARYDFNHRNALLSYFSMKDLPVSVDSDTASAELATGERVIAEFDSAGQVRTINGEALS